MNLFAQESVYFLTGKCGEGKSYMLKYLLTECLKKRVFKFGLVFSQSALYNDDFNMVPKKYIVEGYNPEVLESYINKIKQWRKQNGGKKAPPNFIVVDDILGSMKDDHVWKSFISCHRHTSTYVFISTQYPALISCMAREIVNYAFVFKQSSKQAINAIYKTIGGGADNERDFEQKLKQFTSEKYHCMLFNSRTDEYMEFSAPNKIIKYNFKY